MTRIELHAGPRAELRPLFELAEDSRAELDAYLAAGEVLVARRGENIVGHLQLVDAGPGACEIKNMAVDPSAQRRGVGRLLVTTALETARGRQASRVRVATAAADIGNLRFYQRLGFRLCAIERDAFTPVHGYAPGTMIDGIELRDRVWLDLELTKP